MSIWRVSMVALVVALCSVALTAQQADVSVAIVRADGVLIPIAVLRSGTWRALTTPVGDGLRLTAEARALTGAGWTLFPRDGGRPRALGVKGLTTARAECSAVQGFNTNLPRPPGLAKAEPRRKAGIAVRGNATVERVVDVVAKPDGASQGAAALVSQMVIALEAERLVGRPNAEILSLPATARANRAVSLITLLRYPLDGEDWYYFEAERPYPELGLGSSARGWLSLGGTMWNVSSLRGGFTAIGDPELDYTDALGVVRVGRRALWVTELHSLIDELYELHELRHETESGGPRVLRHLITVRGNHCMP